MKKRKIGSIIIAILILCLLMSTASAATPDDIAQPRYATIRLANASLKIDSSGFAHCAGRVTLTGSYTANVTMELQQSTNSRNWTTVNSWPASGSGVINLDQGWYVSSGYTYRVHVFVAVYNSAGLLSETASADSTIWDY